jgi:hypothetical protein
MTKKKYIRPELQAMGVLEESELLVISIETTGLGDNPEDNLTQDQENLTGDIWNDAMGRTNVWDE